MIAVAGLTLIALGGLGLRALYVGVCNHLEADDVPLHTGIRYVETCPSPLARATARSAPPVMAHVAHR